MHLAHEQPGPYSKIIMVLIFYCFADLLQKQYRQETECLKEIQKIKCQKSGIKDMVLLQEGGDISYTLHSKAVVKYESWKGGEN